jgi:hypothetical protein
MAKDVINVSAVRVAGVGGLGLVFIALLVGWQYPLILATMIAGLVGGAVAAGMVIAYRRRHAGTPSDPGARTVFIPDSAAAPVARTDDESPSIDPHYAHA